MTGMRARRAAMAAAALVVAGAGCTGYGKSGDRPPGHRLVEGELVFPAQVGRQVAGLQVVAVAVKPDFALYGSRVLDPGADRTDRASFVFAVDVERSVSIVLQVPGGAPGTPGQYLGVLQFDDGRGGRTTLLPAGPDPSAPEDVDLGTVTLVQGASPPVDNVLSVGEGDNPLSQIDSDGDGTVDLLDDDDDGDEIPDASDGDVAGDGIEDVTQDLSALPDENGDGVPEPFSAT